MLLNFFLKQYECQHKHVPFNVDEAYCPDCGALIKNQWFIVRCSCCNIKRTAHFEFDDIKPDTKYCPNCGASDFYVEMPDSITSMDLQFAVFKKIVIMQGSQKVTRQIWIEKEEHLLSEKKLLAGK